MSPTAAVNFKQIAAIACGLALGCVFVLYSMCTMRVDKYSHYYLQTKKNVSRGSTEIRMEGKSINKLLLLFYYVEVLYNTNYLVIITDNTSDI